MNSPFRIDLKCIRVAKPASIAKADIPLAQVPYSSRNLCAQVSAPTPAPPMNDDTQTETETRRQAVWHSLRLEDSLLSLGALCSEK